MGELDQAVRPQHLEEEIIEQLRSEGEAEDGEGHQEGEVEIRPLINKSQDPEGEERPIDRRQLPEHEPEEDLLTEDDEQDSAIENGEHEKARESR